MKSEIEIFRTGSHTDMTGKKVTITQNDLVAMAGSYDPEFHEAPIVLGHPENNDPAMGWVKSLSVTEDGILKANLHQVNPDFSEAVDKGAFKKISASLYTPSAPGNPAGENYGLRHVGFLGAQVPAIKGLKAVSFSDDGADAIVFVSDFSESGFLFRSIARAFRGFRDYLIDKDGLETADKVLPDYIVDDLAESANNLLNSETPSPAFSEQPPAQGAVVPPLKKEKEPEMDNDKKDKAADFAEREAALKAREDKVTKAAADFAEAEQVRTAAENASFVERQIKAGKLASGMKAPVLAFMAKIDATDVVSFGEGDAKTALAFFKDMFNAAKPVVDFSEHTADSGKGGSELTSAKDIASAAISFQEEQKIKGITVDIATAVRHVKKED